MNDRSNLPPTAKALMRHLSAPDYIGRALGAHLRTASKGASICAVSAVNTERTVDLFFESRKLDDTAQRMLRLATPKVRRDVRELITAWEAEGDAIAALKKHSKHCADLAHLYHFDPHAPVDMTGHNLSDSVPQNDPALAGVLAAIARRRAIHTRIYEHDPRTAMVAGTILTTMRGERTALAALARLPEGDLRRLRIDLARKRLVGRIWDRVESWPRRPMTEDNGPIAEYDEKARVMLTTATARGQALHDWASPSLESALIDIRKNRGALTRQIKKLTPSVKEKLRPGLFSSEGLQRLCLGEVDDPEPHGNAAPILVPAYARAVIEQERGLAELRAIMMGVDASLRVFMPSPSDLDTNAVARFRQAAYDYFDDKRTFGPPIPLDLNRAIRNELAAIPLGRELLRFAARNDVDICLDIEAKRTRGVYWLGEKKVILNIRPDVPMMASTLIHELNHAYDTIPVWKGPKLNMTLMDQLRANHFFEASSVGAQWTAAMQWFQAGRKTAFARMDQTDKRINRAVLFACVLDANAASNGALERAAFVGWFANASRIQTYDKNYLKNFEKHHVDKTRSGQYGEIHYLKPWWVERFGRGGKGHGGYLDGWGQLLMCDAYFMDRFGSDTEMEIKRLEREMHPPAP